MDYAAYTDIAALDAERMTLERFRTHEERIDRDRGHGATAGGVALSRAYCGELSSVISTKIDYLNSLTSSSEKLWNLKPLSYVIRNLDPDVLALVTLQSLIMSISVGEDLCAAALRAGAYLQGECWSAKLLSSNAKLYARIERDVKLRHGNEQRRRRAAVSMADRNGFRMPDWARDDKLKAGVFLLDCALEALPDVFTVEVVRFSGVDDVVKYPRITEGAMALAEEAIEQAVRRNPAFAPAREAPKPWTRFRDGGYWSERTRLSAAVVRAHFKDTQAAIKASMRDGTMQPHVDAINALQSVPWVINTKVLNVIKWCRENSVDVKGLPLVEDVPLPERLSDEDWKDDKKRKLQKHKLGAAKERNRGLMCERVLFAQDLAIAEELADQQFFTPVNCDWRGRMYSIPHFAFQRDDRVRALFLFRDGLPLGEEGLYWLKVHVANCGQFDGVHKRPFEERVQWVDEHLGPILHTAAAPQHPVSVAWWTQADKPFLFLAACIEFSTALSVGASFVTRLPVSFDGSCSGLQHLCAMTRAAEGSLVNLTPQELPQDVYQTVADLVRTRIVADSNAGNALATICLEHIWSPEDPTRPRKSVKRNVMTYSYSSKKFGMGQQLMEDMMKPLELKVLEGKLTTHPLASPADTVTNEDGTERTRREGTAAAQYLAGHIHAAIESVVHLPAQAMTFLQQIARALAHEGKPASWVTPSGLPWINRYHEPIVKRINLWLSDTKISISLADGNKPEIAKDKAANGIAPNFVHALDASHLALTVNACVAEGIHNIVTVHDSFGCLAPQATRFNAIIREQFVQMYETHDVLTEVLEAAKRDLTVHNLHRLPELPAYGPLDLKEVLNAPFCFA